MGPLPFAAIIVIVLVDLATHDGSVSAQVFFFFPTVYGAALLTRPGAILVTCASLAGELVVVFTQLSVREAVVSSCYMAAALATVAVMLIRSMERQQELVVELARLATIDPLTGLVTRRSFDESVSTALAQRDGDAGTSLVIFDVDRFKSVNDRYGHPGGDKVLVQLSELLVETRRGDVVCRMGGDEIAMLLPRCSIDDRDAPGEEIVEMVRKQGFEVSVSDLIKVSISAGLAHSPTHGSDHRALYAAADAALYDAKRGGRDGSSRAKHAARRGQAGDRDELVVPVGRQVVPVVEQDDAVAQPAPALTAAVGDHVGAAAVGVVYVGASRGVAAHLRIPPQERCHRLSPLDSPDPASHTV